MINKQPTMREKQSAQKRTMIYEKAKALFMLYGYTNTTIADISKATNMSIGSLYHFYKSKEAILLEICEYMGEAKTFNENIEVKAKNPYEYIMDFFAEYMGEWEKLGVDLTMNVYRILDVERLDETKALRKLVYDDGLTKFIEAAQSQGTFDTSLAPGEAAQYIFTVCRGLIYDWCLFNGSFSLTAKTREFLPRILSTFLLG